MNDFVAPIGAIALAIIGVAIVAVIVSNNAQAPQVISALTGGFAQDLSVAISPVTGTTGAITAGLDSLSSLNGLNGNELGGLSYT